MVITNSRLAILKLLLKNPEEEYTIMALSKKAGINYRLAYQEAMQMNKEGIITIKKRGQSSVCMINLKADTALYAFVESMRSKEFLEKYSNINLIAKELGKINTIFYTAVLFGSHAKEKATGRSDIDILLIAPNPEKIEQEADAIAKMLSYPLHINAISEESFDEMKNKKGLNVINEIRGNHIILAGHEAYCKMMAK
ncbi:MAG: nucleotidyltransferase domain-containing protein [Nanoarchaeota archaeon]